MEKGFNNISKSLDINKDNISKSLDINKDNIENNEKLNLSIELAGEKDWEDFKKIRLEAIENEPMAFYVTKSIKEKEINKSEEEWKKELKDANSFVILSKDKDIPIGMTQALLKLKEKNQWHIRGVYLNIKFRGIGGGKEMMDLTLDEIRKRGGKIITLNVMDTQEIARKIYEKYGFEFTDRFEKDVIDGVEYPGGQWMIKRI